MSKIALATAVAALTAAVPLTIGRAEAQQLVPSAAPPWGTSTETKPVPTPVSAPAAQSPRNPGGVGTATPMQDAATPVQGTTTPIQAVFLRSGPNTGSPVIGTLQPGMAVQVLASANHGWMQVETPAGSGWTYNSYLAPPVVPQPAPEEVIER